MKLLRNIVFAFVFFQLLPVMAQESIEQIPEQIILEPHMVQIILNDEHRDGVDWEAIVSDFHSLTIKESEDSKDAKTKISAGAVSNEDYAVLLEALDAVGQISQTSQDPIILIEDKKAILNFQPTDDKSKITIETGLLISSKGDKQLVLTPVITGKTGSTTLDLKQNNTIVIGSIFSEHEVTTTHKFPLLGDLPIVGLVFRNKGKLMQKVETIIFLTPKG